MECCDSREQDGYSFQALATRERNSAKEHKARNNYLLSLLREVKGGKISDIQNSTNESKQVLVTDITVPSLQRDGYIFNQHEFGQVCIILYVRNFTSHDFPQKAK